MRRLSMTRWIVIVLALCAPLLLAGCSILGAGGRAASGAPIVEQAATPTEASPTIDAPTPSPAEESTAEGTADAQASDQLLELAVWSAAPLTASTEDPGGEELLEQLATYDESHPDIQVAFQVKLASGTGSTISYLRSAPPVAPAVLPDLALMDRETLIQATHDELIVPIDGLADPATLEGLYPAALELGSVDGTLVGVPYVLQIQHLAYRNTIFQTPPNSFEQLLQSPVAYFYPAGTLGAVNRTILQQYMAAGGRLIDAEGNPTLDGNVLTQILTFHAEARQAGIIDTALFQITDPADSWALYTGRQAGLTTVTSTQFLADRAEVRSTDTTWIPTLEGEPFALATGWSWVITTTDPDRQAAAISLLNFLMNPVNQGTYTQAAGWLPSQGSALAVWGDDDDYAVFADDLLSVSVAIPDQSLRTTAGVALQDALEDVLLNNVAPVQAANTALQQVIPADDDS